MAYEKGGGGECFQNIILNLDNLIFVLKDSLFELKETVINVEVQISGLGGLQK